MEGRKASDAQLKVGAALDELDLGARELLGVVAQVHLRLVLQPSAVPV